MMEYKNSRQFAVEADQKDSLKAFKNKFIIPQHNGNNSIYFTGNSLGLQPVDALKSIEQELKDWGTYGVEGHFQAKNPWYSYHEALMQPAANIVGAKKNEVVHLNGLSTNIHLLMVSFYRPTKTRYKIICEKKAFPSDQYILESQVKFHGFDPTDAVVEISPRAGEHNVRLEDILQAIQENKNSLALVFIGGVNYYTGQIFDMETITKEGHKVGAIVGFDLAHAVGNIEMQLHNWQIDFAAWCSYKYLNSGPGSVGGIFVHEKHGGKNELPRFAGWWGHDKATRFDMEPGFKPMQGAEGWQLSNAPVFSMAIHKVSLEIFNEAGIKNLREKSVLLTGYLNFIVKDIIDKNIEADIEIITPQKVEERGCQLSILIHKNGRKIFEHLAKNGVIADWREPNVIRLAPVPLYNSFLDVFEFGEILEEGLGIN
jgi:kynureninase